MLGFKRFETAAATIQGIELAEKIKKQQFNLKPLTGKATSAPDICAAVLSARLENLNFGFIDFYYLSHDRTSMNKHICLLLISIASVSPCLAGSSTAHGTTKQHRSGGYVQIEPRSYNTETRSFDRPWPFGPESGAQ
jgi:hypothetical protein